MPTSSAKVRLLFLVVVTLGLAFTWLSVGANGADAEHTPPVKKPPPTVEELDQQLKAGTFKLTEPDVVMMAGPPASYKQPGDAGSELKLQWEYATFIYATFKEGKLVEATGGFAAHLPVENVTLPNFRRLRVGIPEAQAVELLGEGHGTTRVGSTVTHSWGRTARLWVSINAKGLVFNPGSEMQNSVRLPPGIPLPIPGAKKP